ncbi:MAG: hypothetical protein IH606_00765 [Burkholderiales bacterium]|nr:hypothetical protein [Burkholderiales bacterium]
MSTQDEVAQAYVTAANNLLAVRNSPDSSDAVAEAAEKALNELTIARMDQIVADYAGRTAALNHLVERLNGVTSQITVDAAAAIKSRLAAAITNARDLLLRDAAERIAGGAAQPPSLHAVVADEPALGAAPAPQADKSETPEVPELPVAPARPKLDAAAPVIATRPTLVPENLSQDYEKLFATCAVGPDRIGQVNWHLQKLEAGRQRYQAVGGPLGIPWWFIGIIHGLETGFRFDRHLHNGDPLTARTVHVPKNRPTGNPPFSWEASADDALRWEKLDQWTDWSAAGVLFKWEKYNGFGYRKHHPDVLTPYLWSFTNQYAKGKYVADGQFDPNAISKQCGAAAMLRTLVNSGAVSLA